MTGQGKLGATAGDGPVAALPGERSLLLVEDNAGDALLLRSIFREIAPELLLTVVPDGEAAIDFLLRRGEVSARLPDLILMDLNLPKRNGFEVLGVIRSEAALRHLPVFILTTSQAPQDAARAQALGVAGFFTKPAELADMEALVTRLVCVEIPRALSGGASAEALAVAAAAPDPEAQTPKVPATGRVSAEALRLLVEAVKDYCIFMLDPQGHVMSWNEGAQRTKQYRPHEIIGKHFSIFYPPEAVRTGHPDNELRIAEREGRYHEEGWRVRKDGTRFWASVTITAVRSPDGNLIGFGKVTRDMTERKLVEERLRESEERVRRLNVELEKRVQQRTRELEAKTDELQRQTKELERSNSDLQQFAYVASHDLQEPLRTVVSYLQFLKKRAGDKLDADSQQFIEFAVDSAYRMRALVQDLLSYARIGSGGASMTSVDLEDVVQHVTANLRGKIKDADAVLTKDRLPTITADRTQMIQVFQNLLGNALTYRSPDRRLEVHVGARDEGDRWTFSVRDNGIGIAPAYWEKIFVIFQRLHGDREKYPGTGIGLAICKRIVEGLGGRIWVDSRAGEGTCFLFSVPKAGPHSLP